MARLQRKKDVKNLKKKKGDTHRWERNANQLAEDSSDAHSASPRVCNKLNACICSTKAKLGEKRRTLDKSGEYIPARGGRRTDDGLAARRMRTADWCAAISPRGHIWDSLNMLSFGARVGKEYAGRIPITKRGRTMGHIHLRGKWRPRTPRWYNAALTHTKWMGNPSSPTLSSNCENRRACFCQTSPGMHVWGVLVPIRTEAKPSLVFPTAMVVKVKDAKTTRKQSKCSAYDNTKKSPFVFV